MNRYLPDTNVFSKIFSNNLSVKQYVETFDAVIDCDHLYRMYSRLEIEYRKNT